MPSFVPAAFVSAEDARFFVHHGFDTAQIAKSFEIDLRDHRLARGGSTISQQLVKNTFLTQRRSVDRKIQEAILTWRLEARLDKQTIIERYLNIIELGPHIFGIRAAAKYWFNESPHELTLHQAAFLAALTSEPRSMSRRIRHAQGLDPDSASRVDVILRAMTRDGAIDMAAYQRASETPLYFAQTALHAEP
jgi:membrane peptidoglycan carboxypeptidase